MSEQTVLVTGASGFIGQAVVETLLKRGHRVRALLRSKEHAPFVMNERLELIEGKMEDRESLSHAVKGVDAVIHLAARKADAADSEAVNVGGAENLRSVCEQQGVHLIINVSTQSVNVARKGVYGRTKKRAEDILRGSTVPVITLRPSVVYADTQTGVLGQIIRFTHLPVVPVIGTGDTTYAPIHRDDAAEIIVRCLERPELAGEILDVGGPEMISFNEIVDELLRRRGDTKFIIHIPVLIALTVAKFLSFLPHPPLTVSNVLGAHGKTAPMDLQRTFATFGFSPRRFAEGLDAIFPALSSNDLEATALLRYVYPQFHVTPAHRKRYSQALSAQHIDTVHRLDPLVLQHRWLLCLLDAFTRLGYPQCILRKKLLIAAALVESDPQSADWLLPRYQSKARVMLSLFWVGCKAVTKDALALSLFLFPFFVKRNAGL